MLKQKQIKDLRYSTLAELTASGLVSPDFAFITAENAFYTVEGGVPKKINPHVSNLSYTAAPTQGTVVSDNGTDAIIPAADSTNAGLLLPGEKEDIAKIDDLVQDVADLTTLTGVASNATNLGTFTGSTIPDNSTIKAAFQSIETAVEGMIPLAQKGVADGVATLDSTGKVPASQLPSYVDDVLEFANLAAFPATGETGKLYTALDSNKLYRWSGSTYVEVSAFSGVASDVAFNPTGNIAATNVQAAIEELDNEKQDKITYKEEGTGVAAAGAIKSVNFVGANVTASASGSDLTITIADSVATVTDTTTVDLTLTGTELKADVKTNSISNALLAQAPAKTLKGNDTTGTANEKDLTVTEVKAMLAYTASEITNVAAGNIAATDVQAALNELDAEKQVSILFQEDGTSLGTSGTVDTIDFSTGVLATRSGNKVTITSTGTTENFYRLTPTANNTVPNLSPVPLNPTKVQFSVNGLIESAGITCDASGVVTINSTVLGYTVDTTDVVEVQYLSA